MGSRTDCAAADKNERRPKKKRQQFHAHLESDIKRLLLCSRSPPNTEKQHGKHARIPIASRPIVHVGVVSVNNATAGAGHCASYRNVVSSPALELAHHEGRR